MPDIQTGKQEEKNQKKKLKLTSQRPKLPVSRLQEGIRLRTCTQPSYSQQTSRRHKKRKNCVYSTSLIIIEINDKIIERRT